MSTLSPRSAASRSATPSPFQENYQDPYLSAPSDPETEYFKNAAIRLTPVSDDVHNNGPPDSSPSSPHAHKPTGGPYSGWSSRVPPSANLPESIDMSTGWAFEGPPDLGPLQINDPGEKNPGAVEGNLPFSQPVLKLPQRQNPLPFTVTTPPSDVPHTPSSTGDMGLQVPRQGSRQGDHDDTHSPHHASPPIADLAADNLNIHLASFPGRTRSPSIKVETISRGDSPERDATLTDGRQSHPSAYLSPDDANSLCGESGDRLEVSDGSISRESNGSWVPNSETGQAGVDPSSRSELYVRSPKELEDQRLREEKNSDIEDWLSASEIGDEVYSRRHKNKPESRPRAKSTGDPSLQEGYFDLKFWAGNVHVPGPNVLLDEPSDEDYDSETSGSHSASLSNGPGHENVSVLDSPSPKAEGSPRSVIPEQDTYPFPPTQPLHSNAAIIQFERLARETDALSRKATWGTDIRSIISEKDSDNNGKKPDRRGSILRRLRHDSSLKRQLSVTSIAQPKSDPVNNDNDKKKRDSISFRPQRHFPFSRGRSPSRSSRGSFSLAFPGKYQLQTSVPSLPGNRRLGGGSSELPLPEASTPPSELIKLMIKQGGPPVSTIAWPLKSEHSQADTSRQDFGDADADDEGNLEGTDEKRPVMEFPIPPRLPVPTPEGFKAQILELNPRLLPCLLDRFAKQQSIRYKTLVELKAKHARSVTERNCASDQYCIMQGGKATLLPLRANPQESDAATCTQFNICGNTEDDGDVSTVGEGIVAAAQFPQGVHPPPVKRLPAKFECPICFEVVTFHKPSDWTKHVHEDVLPFTCTFPNCNEPMSFKRKADWVRHENERHRQLEWWTCTIADCSHKCYRKHNFVQHLIKEHDMVDPNARKAKNGGAAAKDKANLITVEMVENCRHETDKNPRDEPCRFCGNLCPSWKKLSSHLAKHLEQIALPILGLVEERTVTSTEQHGPQSTPKPTPRETMQQPQYHDGTGPKLGMVSNFNQTQNLVVDLVRTMDSGIPSSYTYPNPLQVPNNMQAMQPGATHGHGYMSQYGWASHETQAGTQGYLLQPTPVHQNSVSYPPPRPRSSDLAGLNIPVESYLPNISASPTEMSSISDLQGQLQTSAAEGKQNQTYQNHMAQTMPQNQYPTTVYYSGAVDVTGNGQEFYSTGYNQYTGFDRQYP